MRDRPRLQDTLERVKFVCKELWTVVWDKQIDNLRTNHRVRRHGIGWDRTARNRIGALESLLLPPPLSLHVPFTDTPMLGCICVTGSGAQNPGGVGSDRPHECVRGDATGVCSRPHPGRYGTPGRAMLGASGCRVSSYLYVEGCMLRFR